MLHGRVLVSDFLLPNLIDTVQTHLTDGSSRTLATCPEIGFE